MRSVVLWLGFAGLLFLASCGGATYDPGETTASSCQDGADNDQDGRVDCDDSDCEGFLFCEAPSENTSIRCLDEVDNDGDGRTDCEDADCADFNFCDTELEETASRCQDGLDNDEDGLTDCADEGCQGFVFCVVTEADAGACQDGQDNDGDGQSDCEDPDCQVFWLCLESSVSACRDSLDNDGDGRTDCDDVDCQGFLLCHESTAPACQDGSDNDGDGLADCEDDDCRGFVFCVAAEGESTWEQCQDGADNDGDGDADCEDRGCWPWGFCGTYHGFPLVDAWGETWDGLERTPLPFAEAQATCEAVHGRLPTVTELWRNNATTGTSDLSDTNAGDHLWTFMPNHQAGHRVTVRLSDGQRVAVPGVDARRFRCVWPDGEGAGFDADRCHGDPSAPCWEFDRIWNLDTRDRPEVDFVTASHECGFYGASVPVAAEWNSLIHDGLPNGSGEPLWAAEAMYWYNSHYGYAVVTWTDDIARRWEYLNNGWGGISVASDPRRFRCIGLADPGAYEVPAPVCHENCASFGARRSVLVADDTDRTPAPMWLAATQCRSEGAVLPSASDATQLIQAGWVNGSNEWSWVTDAMYWYNGHYGAAVVRWTGDGAPSYHYTNAGGWVSTTAETRAFRCVWGQTGPAVPACTSGQVVAWQDTAFVCQPGGDGDSGGNAFPAEFVDDWGNAWDAVERPAKTFPEARADCESQGGRLPRATEIFAVRFLDNPHPPIGDQADVNHLWTETPVAADAQQAVVRVSDGLAMSAVGSDVKFYRCVWPAVRSDVLHGNNCYGPADDACFLTPSGLIADKYDRVALDAAGAINECRAAGGHLPDHREVIELIHEGWMNGTNAWNWMGEFVYFYNGGHGYPIHRWVGHGLPEWDYAHPLRGATSWANEYRSFRCVYDTRLR